VAPHPFPVNREKQGKQEPFLVLQMAMVVQVVQVVQSVQQAA
jgi:hypothetical protein